MAQSKSVRLVTEAALDTSQTKALAPIKNDVADLKVLAGLNPGSPNDASTSNFIETPGTLTHTALSGAIGDRIAPVDVRVAALASRVATTITSATVGKVTLHPSSEPIPSLSNGEVLMTYKVPGANFYTDFSGSTVGSAPAGWTERWAPQSSWLVEADASASGGKVLAVNPTGASRFLLSWDAASNDPDAKNFEILMRSKMVGGTTQGMAVGAGRASGATLAESAYRGGGRSAIAVTASKYVAGAYTDLLSAADTQVADTWYLTRFRVNGSSIGVKVWPSGTTEPTAWVQATDVGITAKGWIGLNVGTPGKNVIDYVAVATAGRKASKP